MSLDLNKLSNKLDEALSNETSETLTKFLNYKIMSNNKQTDHIVDTNKMVSSVEWLAIQLWEEMNMQGDGEVFNRLLDQAKAMHKEEIVQTYDDGIMKGRHQDGIEYYTYIFGGNNDQQ